jgi:transcriptional regulator with XRE-family HTH domain
MAGVRLTEQEKERLSELGRTIRALRVAKHWSQETLAKKAGVHRNTIYSLERSPAFVNIRAVERVAIALETPLWKLLKFVAEVLHAA